MFYENLMTKLVSCPECKSEMHEIHRTQEKGTTYMWLQCTKQNCNGQWLQKIPNFSVAQDKNVEFPQHAVAR